ncbi:MAG: Lrp/AsnC ligand binding domain-containing protein [Thaumarchaeota archaeon]|nr:Lrp/AsnC ligand binding domain-containing protein [Nitrososphaerota archaeon]
MSTAYFLMNIAINHENEVIRKIRDALESDVMLDFEIQGTLGVYDLVLKITAKSDDDLRHVLLEKIKPIDNIQSAITMMVI